jgi:hypothetical protein
LLFHLASFVVCRFFLVSRGQIAIRPLSSGG